MAGPFQVPCKTVSTATASKTVAAGTHLPVDATAGAITITLPTGANQGAHLSVEKRDTTANVVSITGSIRGATATLTLQFQHESLEFVADAAGSWQPTANHLPKAAVDKKIADQAQVDAGKFSPLPPAGTTAGYLATVGSDGKSIQFSPGAVVPNFDQTYVWAVTDQTGRIAIGITADGTTVLSKYVLAAGAVSKVMLDAAAQAQLVDPVAAATLKAMPASNLDSYVWAITDQDGRIALGIRPDGHLVVPAIELGAGTVKAATLAADVPLPVSFNEGAGYVWAVTDQNARIAIAVRPSGALAFSSLDAATLAYLTNALQLAQTVAPVNYSTPEGATRAITSGPDIVCWGDSLTIGAGASTAAGNAVALSNGYPGVLASLTGRTVRNSGVGGETSVTIAARTGANPFLLLPDGGQIPASGAVKVALSQISGQTVRPLLQGNGAPGGGFDGILAGVPGTLGLVQPNGVSATFTEGTDYYTFTRTTSGSAVTCNRPMPYRTTYSAARRGDIAVLWIGQNGPSDARAIADAQAVVRHLTALHQRYLVMSRPSSTDAADAAFHDAFGRRFIAIRRYLVDYGLADSGITATSQDTTDIGNGTVPTSLRVDAVHLNAAGYTVVAQQVYLRLLEHGWV